MILEHSIHSNVCSMLKEREHLCTEACPHFISVEKFKPINKSSSKMPGLKYYLEYMDQLSMLKTEHRLTQDELDLLEAAYKFIVRQSQLRLKNKFNKR